MSIDIAYPAFCAPGLPVALGTARRLMEFGRYEDSKVDVFTELCSVAEVRRMARELPQGRFSGQWDDKEFDGVPLKHWPPLVAGVLGPDLPTAPAAYEGRLPVEYELGDLPVDSIEDAFAAAIGPNMGWINWKWLYWPDVPERNLHGESTHAEVTLLFNTRTRNDGRRQCGPSMGGLQADVLHMDLTSVFPRLNGPPDLLQYSSEDSNHLSPW
ncbi:hypothetical protein [Streptomyces sp. NPDC058751]|uniref:hypothetical protein n=1 Tax=Streptomyces sp. NPDC058751 TaxID=3346623 RepID=UPI003686ED7F